MYIYIYIYMCTRVYVEDDPLNPRLKVSLSLMDGATRLLRYGNTVAAALHPYHWNRFTLIMFIFI